MKRAIVVAASNHDHQTRFGGAFAQGLRRHGWSVTIQSDFDPSDLLVQWGVRRKDRIARQKAGGGEICILERGYVGDRFKWTSVSFGGGLNGRGVFRGPFADASRWDKNFAGLINPWRAADGGYALIMGQVPSNSAVANVNLPEFYDRAAAEFARRGIAMRYRPHPNVRQSCGLEQDLAGARCVVTWNSNSAVDAVLAGIPAIAMDEGSMAWDVTGHDLAPPPAPERTAWARALAWKQWTAEEMASGECWATVGAIE